jgi:hypothetical protein
LAVFSAHRLPEADDVRALLRTETATTLEGLP